MAAGMTLGGWIFMLVSWGVIIGFTIYCLVKLMADNGSK